MTLTVDQFVVDSIVLDAQQRHPVEACGVVCGREGVPTHIVAMRNAEHSTEFFSLDPDEQLRVWQLIENWGAQPLIIYHSHTASRAVPSATDSAYLTDVNIHYVIVSTDPAGQFEFRSYRATPAGLVEEMVELR